MSEMSVIDACSMNNSDNPFYINLPINIVSESASGLFSDACMCISEYGRQSAPRGMTINELSNVTMTLINPQNNIVDIEARNISVKYLLAEWLWYVKGDQDKAGSDFICKYAPFWDTLRNPDGSLNSNYGHYFFKRMDEVLPTEEEFKPISDYYFQKSQFHYVIDTLLKDSDSRQAVVNINNIYHKAHPTKDFPCTTAMQFFIRDNKLHMTVTMRSTDLVLGYCNDVFQFTMFQRIVLNELNKELRQMNKHGIAYAEDDGTLMIVGAVNHKPIKMGTFTLFTTSLHVYERHFKMMENTVHNREKKKAIPDIKWIYNLSYDDWKSIANNEKNDERIVKYRTIIEEILNS